MTFAELWSLSTNEVASSHFSIILCDGCGFEGENVYPKRAPWEMPMARMFKGYGRDTTPMVFDASVNMQWDLFGVLLDADDSLNARRRREPHMRGEDGNPVCGALTVSISPQFKMPCCRSSRFLKPH